MTAIIVDYAMLGLTVDHVRHAALKLPTSPVYEMFRAHLLQLARVADGLPDDEAVRTMLNTSTLELARALISTAAAGPDRDLNEALRQSEQARMTVYLRQHLRDRDLNAAMIAHALGISQRQVYKLWAERGASLSEYIVTARLTGAKKELRSVELAHFSITEIAHRWGFVSGAHFSTKFHAAFDMSPSEWRRRPAGTDR